MQEFEAVPGRGLACTVTVASTGRVRVVVGNRAWMTENGITVTSEADDAMKRCGWVGDVGGVSGCECVGARLYVCEGPRLHRDCREHGQGPCGGGEPGADDRERGHSDVRGR